MRYKFGKTVTYVPSDEQVIEPWKIRKDSKVRVHYLKDGNGMVVDKDIVTGDVIKLASFAWLILQPS